MRFLHLLHWQAGSLSLVRACARGQLHASLRQEVGGTSHIAVPQFKHLEASLVAQMVKNLPVMRETLGGEDPL